MKKRVTLFTALVCISSFLISCGGSKPENKEQTETPAQQAAVYACPMKCEGDKTYDQPGKCPVCGMDLKAVETMEYQPDSESETEVEQDTV